VCGVKEARMVLSRSESALATDREAVVAGVLREHAPGRRARVVEGLPLSTLFESRFIVPVERANARRIVTEEAESLLVQ
jgi:hypothetical protein